MQRSRFNFWAAASLLIGIVAVVLIVIPGRADLINPALFACAGAVVLGIIALTRGSKGGGKLKGTWLAYIGIVLPFVSIVVLLMLMATATRMP